MTSRNRSFNVVALPVPETDKAPSRGKAIDAKTSLIIMKCVECAQAIGAGEYGFRVDPTGDSEFAASRDRSGEVLDLLDWLAAHCATSAAAASAKCRLIPLLTEYYGNGLNAFHEGALEFLRSAAIDSDAFLKPQID